MKRISSIIVLLLLVAASASFGADDDKSLYKNNEKHIAKKADANNVPIDPACKMKMVWDNVRFSGVARNLVGKNELKKITIVKFNHMGAWIAWSDEKGYHELIGENFIPWRSFPKAIRDYFAKYYLPNWKIYKTKKAFTSRTPQFNRNGKALPLKSGKIILKRSATGLLCKEIFHNVFAPYSEFPLEVRSACGYYENEAYLPNVPVMAREKISFDDPVLFIDSNSLIFMRRFKDGMWMARATIKDNGKNVSKNILVEPFKGRPRANHRSDLHDFRESRKEKTCAKCGLSDHLNERFFNYMFDRQSRTRCSKKHIEFALTKKDDKKIGKYTFPTYELDFDYDKKNPDDSKTLIENAPPAAEEEGGGEEETPPGME